MEVAKFMDSIHCMGILFFYISEKQTTKHLVQESLKNIGNLTKIMRNGVSTSLTLSS